MEGKEDKNFVASSLCRCERTDGTQQKDLPIFFPFCSICNLLLVAEISQLATKYAWKLLLLLFRFSHFLISNLMCVKPTIFWLLNYFVVRVEIHQFLSKSVHQIFYNSRYTFRFNISQFLKLNKSLVTVLVMGWVQLWPSRVK